MKKLILLSLIFGGALEAANLRMNIRRAQRRINNSLIRSSASVQATLSPLLAQLTNGDEARYEDKRNSFAKGLAQLDTGFPNTAAFKELVAALESGDPALFDQITMGTSPIARKLVSPQASLVFSFNGKDSWIFSMPAAPALTSAENAGEMVEDYWHALLRDVAFNDYDTDAMAAAAVADLNNLSDFRGPKVGGVVTAGTLFRGNTPGDLVGPYISQFLYLPMPWGPAINYDGSGTMAPFNARNFQKQIVPTSSAAVNDFMKNFTDWLDVQKGKVPTGPGKTITFNEALGRTFIRNGRDLSDFVHQDFPEQAYMVALLILHNQGAAALDRGNPYLNDPTQDGFVTYGIGDVIYFITLAGEMALRAAWYQKWQVHRRARPEYCGFLIHQQKTGAQDFGLHSDVIDSDALSEIFDANSTYFLPQAYPEGSPLHPSYPAGHATIAGACATILKAFYNEDFIIPNPVEPNAGNTDLVNYTGTPLTAGGEINKLAANISIGRDIAGVHYRSDGIEGMKLGEQVAIAILEQEAFARNESFGGFSFTKFDGTKVTIGGKVQPAQL